jgi:hypothetical protein
MQDLSLSATSFTNKIEVMWPFGNIAFIYMDCLWNLKNLLYMGVRFVIFVSTFAGWHTPSSDGLSFQNNNLPSWL